MKYENDAIETRSDYYHAGRIVFKFLTGDDEKGAEHPPKEGEDFVRSKCIVRVGDFDAVTGQFVTEEMIRDYNRCAWNEIKKNLQYEKDVFTEEEEALRKAIGQAYRITFREDHGYNPSKDDVLLEKNTKVPVRWYVHLSVLEENEKGEYEGDRKKKLSLPPKEMDWGEKSPEMKAVLSVVASLDEMEMDIWKVMLMKIIGGEVKPRFKAVADKWDLTPGAITKIKKKIKWMMQKRAEELRAQESDSGIEESE